jgi:Cu(I)/Ag(I) efflux system membrane protein CusA/SilA
VADTRSVYAERVAQGYFTDIQIDREAIARYGLTVGDVQDVIQAALGGGEVTQTVEGRQRYPVNVRYAAAFRGEVAETRLIMTRSGKGSASRHSARLAWGPVDLRTYEPHFSALGQAQPVKPALGD